MKTTFVFVSLLTFSFSVFAAGAKSSDLKSELQKIAENANVANGGTEIKKYDIDSLDIEKSMDSDMKIIKKEYPKCGPFKKTVYRRDTIEAINKKAFDPDTAKALTDLYNQGKIVKMYSILTNNDIDCSRMWVEVFTSEGLLLELYYGMND